MNMNTVARRVLRWIWGPNREGIVLTVLVVLALVMSAISPAFFTVSTLFSLLRSSIVPMIYALGVLLVIISGGIDVSFAAIASFASYATIVFQLGRGINIGLFGSFAMALTIEDPPRPAQRLPDLEVQAPDPHRHAGHTGNLPRLPPGVHRLKVHRPAARRDGLGIDGEHRVRRDVNWCRAAALNDHPGNHPRDRNRAGPQQDHVWARHLRDRRRH